MLRINKSTAKEILCLIHILLLWLPYTQPLNLLVSGSMNGLAIVLVQTAAVKHWNYPNHAKLNWVEVWQLHSMACVRLLWIPFLWSLVYVTALCKLHTYIFDLSGMTSYTSPTFAFSSKLYCSSSPFHSTLHSFIKQCSWHCAQSAHSNHLRITSHFRTSTTPKMFCFIFCKMSIFFCIFLFFFYHIAQYL